MMIRVGNSAYNPQFIRSIHIRDDRDGVMRSIIAVTDRRTEIILKSINTYETPEDEVNAFINRWFNHFIKIMEG